MRQSVKMKGTARKKRAFRNSFGVRRRIGIMTMTKTNVKCSTFWTYLRHAQRK